MTDGINATPKHKDASLLSRCLKNPLLWGIATLAAVFLSCSAAVSHVEFYSAADVIQSLCLLARWCVASIFDPSALPDLGAQAAALGPYYEVRTRLLISLLTVGCGVLLAVSGSVYQLVFKNPLAAPTMLGVSNGVQIGVLILVLQFGGAAVFMNSTRYLYCFIGAVAILAFVLVVTKLICGRGSFSVYTMLLVAAIFSQIFGSISGYILSSVFDDDTLIVYQEILQVMDVAVEPLTFAILAIALAAAVVPMFALSFSMNTLSFAKEEANLMGISQNALRAVSLTLATVMIIAAEVLVGTVSMVALVVPFISRAFFGAEFSNQLKGDLVIAPLVLLICRFIADSIPFVGLGVPIGVVVNFVLLPFFAIIVAGRYRTWE